MRLISLIVVVIFIFLFTFFYLRRIGSDIEKSRDPVSGQSYIENTREAVEEVNERMEKTRKELDAIKSGN
jgi:ABC-type dipeptide/oligopeptide/nickel transport system permease component